MASIPFRVHTQSDFMFGKMDFPECRLHVPLPFHSPVHYVQEDREIF